MTISLHLNHVVHSPLPDIHPYTQDASTVDSCLVLKRRGYYGFDM